MQYKKLAVLAAAVAFATAAAAHADTVTLTLLTPSVIDSNGPETITFDATVSAPLTNGAAVYLNGDSLNVEGPLTADDTDFYVNYPFFLNPGQSFSGDLFTVTVPSGTPFQTYDGSFVLLGGSDGNAADSLATANFSVAVSPEPSSLALLGSGVAVAGARFRRRREVTRV